MTLNLLMTTLADGHDLIVFGAIWTQSERHVLVRWLTAADLDLSFALEISSISVRALELVSGLSLLAQLFALGYMEKDWAIARFFALELSPITATLLDLALIASSVGKCAHFPLHLWLDEAMEGSNPASVLRNSLVVACVPKMLW